MTLAIGVKFRRNGPLSYFSAEPPDLALGDRVVADTARGAEIGEVVMAAADVADALLPAELRPVLRRASAGDLETRRVLDERAPEQIRLAKERIHALGLEMKVFAATTAFDGGRILFDFSAEGRVEVHDLARDLATAFHCRVELRQIYPRDEARLQDGYGPCGRRLCCSSWLKEFQPVSIKHAKEQGLPLNPAKLNGMCGKLKCCLTYESDQYVELKARLPRPGAIVEIAEGEGKVRDIDVPRELVMVQLVETGAVVRVPAATMQLREPSPAPLGGETSRGRRKRRRGTGGRGDAGPGAAGDAEASEASGELAEAPGPEAGDAGDRGGFPAGDEPAGDA
ncbi:MAG TPA: regulatory iron-sulfur-containing complex subunit RicT [Candidatus Dormibacteraeota bacterium]|nr:regulatory iron-sulfur-containing complex subunit RicT [Candidatus Dormibacteraeota bacterium]